MTKCQFCGAPPKSVKNAEVITFKCGTVAGDQEPRSKICWRGYVEQLKAIINKLTLAAGKGILTGPKG